MVDHPVTKLIQPINPPLTSDEAIEAYFGVSDERRHDPVRHAFVLLVYVGDRTDPVQVVWQSRSPDTHAERAKLGAVLSMLNWLVVNNAQANPVTVYVIDEWMVNLRKTVRSVRPNMAELYRKIGPLLEAYPQVRFKWLKAVPEGKHHERRARAQSLAREEVQQLFDSVR